MSQIREVHRHNIESESQDSNSSDDDLINSKVQQLQEAFDKFQKFQTQLPSDKQEFFQKEIIQYSGKQSVLSKSHEEISKLCQKRIQKMLRNKKTKKNWNQDDVDILVWVLNKFSAFYAKKSIHEFLEADWKFVSSIIPATSWKKCMFKWLSLKKFSLLTFRWSNEESQILTNLIKQNGKKNWKRLAQKLYVANSSKQKVFRTPKQCRQHWNCYLNPSIKKGPWSVDQDIRLLENVLQLNCLKKWSEVAKTIKGRTQNAVKNRFSLLLDKQKRLTGQQNQKNLINRVLVKLIHEQVSQKGYMKSQELEQIEAPNQLFEQSESSENLRIKDLKHGLNLDGKTQGAQQNQKVQEKNERKIIIPTVIQSEPFFAQPQFFPMNPGFTPYFFNLMYTGPYQMN